MICHECSYKTRDTPGRKHLNRNLLWYLFADGLGEAISNRTLKISTQLQYKERYLPTHIDKPTRIQAAGNMPKIIDEFFGRVNSKTERLSIAHMRSPAGWLEPGQTPEFEEYTIVIRGKLRVQHKGGSFDVSAGQAVVAHPGEWIQYSTPDEATEYIAICLPAFSPKAVHRDDAS